MLKSLKRMTRDEKILLILGMILTLVVFILINYYFTGQGLIFWALVETGLMWAMLISLLILADNHRVLNEELKEIIREHIEESKTMKELSNEQLQEIRLIKKFANEAISYMRKGKKKKSSS